MEVAGWDASEPSCIMHHIVRYSSTRRVREKGNLGLARCVEPITVTRASAVELNFGDEELQTTQHQRGRKDRDKRAGTRRRAPECVVPAS
jgi:hypothetical protein